MYEIHQLLHWWNYSYVILGRTVSPSPVPWRGRRQRVKATVSRGCNGSSQNETGTASFPSDPEPHEERIAGQSCRSKACSATGSHLDRRLPVCLCRPTLNLGHR